MQTRALAQSAAAGRAGLQPRTCRRHALSWRLTPFLAPGLGARLVPCPSGSGAVRPRQPGAVQVQAILKGLGSLLTSDPAEKTRKKYADRVAAINALEPQVWGRSGVRRGWSLAGWELGGDCAQLPVQSGVSKACTAQRSSQRQHGGRVLDNRPAAPNLSPRPRLRRTESQ